MAERILSVRLRAIVDGYEQAMGRAATATERVAEKGKQLESAGKKMTMGFSVPMMAMGGIAVKAATNFESAFTGVQKVITATDAELEMLRSGIIDMAKELPSSREEIAGVAQAAGQLGISTGSILSFTRTMIDLGNATDIVAQDAAMSLAQMANITQMPESEFSNLGSTIVMLGNNLATTESKIVEMATRLAAAGSQIGLTQAETMGLAGALAQTGLEAQAGGTAMSRVMVNVAQAVSQGGDELERWAQVAGMVPDQFAQVFQTDTAAAISAVIVGLGKLSTAGEDVFGVLDELGAADVRVRDALLRLAGSGDQFDKAMRLANQGWEENIALTNEAALRYGTTESQMRIAANRVSDLGRQFGETLLPAVHATLNVVEPLANGMSGLIAAMASAPAPLKILGGSILAVAVASGPAMWAMGKLIGLFGPMVRGAIGATASVKYLAASMGSLAATRGVTGAAASLGVLKASLAGLVGPQMAVVAGAAAIGAAMYVTHRRAQEFASSHVSAGEAAITLAESAGIAADELQRLGDEAEGVEPPVSDEQFRRANEDTLKTLKEIGDLAGQQGMLMEIAYGMRLRGVDPDQVLEQVTKLARIAGIEIPVSLTLEGIDDFDVQLEAVRVRTQRAFESMLKEGDVRKAEADLEGIARAAAEAWETDNIGGFVRVLAAAEQELSSMGVESAALIEHLMVQAGRFTEIDGLKREEHTDLEGLLNDIRQGYNDAAIPQRSFIDGVFESAEAMEAASRAGELAAGAQEHGTLTMEQHLEKVREATEAVTDIGGEQSSAAESAEEFAKAVELTGNRAQMATLDYDAAAAATQAFADALERSTDIDNRMRAGLSAGSALKSLHEGMTGQKALAAAAEQAAERTKDTASAVDQLGDAVRRADPKLSAMQMRIDALAAAGSAFSESIAQSTMLDDQISSALSLGDAYRDFSKTFQRLPGDIDFTAMAMGKLRPRTAEAVQNMLRLGKASTDYLATLIEMGSSEEEVRAEAARMRDEYVAQFRQMGLNEDQIRRYLEAMGLTPEQVETAIKVSGLEEARFQLNAYMQLLEGRIPDEIAVAIIGDLEAGNVEEAARRLAAWARTNPARIEVEADTKEVDRLQERVEEIHASLWDLPKSFDPLKAALGQYTDEQHAALDAVMQFGDAITGYLSNIAGSGDEAEVRAQAKRIQEEFLAHLATFEIVDDAAQEYLNLVGLSDWQIESAITLSGDAEAMFRLEMYAQFMDDTIPPEILTEVMTLMDEGKLQDAANRLTWWRWSEEQKPVTVPVEVAFPDFWISDMLFGGGASRGGRRRPGFSTGGRITGPGTSTTDSVPIRASTDEFMIRASSARKIGYEQLQRMNDTGTIPGSSVSLADLNTTPSGAGFDDRRLVQRLERLERSLGGGPLIGEMTVVSPTERQTPRRIAEAVSRERWLGGGR